MFACCVCSVLCISDLCDLLITHSEESNQLLVYLYMCVCCRNLNKRGGLRPTSAMESQKNYNQSHCTGSHITTNYTKYCQDILGPDSVVRIVTRHGPDASMSERRWGRDFSASSIKILGATHVTGLSRG